MEGSDSLGDISLRVPSVAERALVIAASATDGPGSGLEFASDLPCNKASAAASEKRVLKRRLSGLEPRLLLPRALGGMGSTSVVSRVMESGSAK